MTRAVLYGERVYVTDPRTPIRRLGISVHPEDGLVVLTLWHGGICTGTFRLPVRDAPTVIATLAGAINAANDATEAMGDAEASA